MKRKIVRLILIQSLLGIGVAHGEQRYTPKTTPQIKKIINIDYSVDEDSLEPCPHMSVAKKTPKPGLNIHPSFTPEKNYTSNKDFGTENDGKFNRSIASVDKEKPKPISLKKALKIFRRQSDRDLSNNYE